jgi:Tfp pilus assembly protein PilF
VTLATQRRLTLVLLLGVPVVALCCLGWFGWRSPHSRFLPPGAGAEWILYPVPPQVTIVPDRYPQRAEFRRSFELAGTPETARLRLRAFGEVRLQINGQQVDLPGAERWQEERAAEVAGQLRAGSNEIQVGVANAIGPPLLWLSLEGTGWKIPTDEQWTVSLDGATDSPAHRAGEPLPIRSGNPAAGGTRTLDGLRNCVPALVILGLVTTCVLWLGKKLFRYLSPPGPDQEGVPEEKGPDTFLALLWLARKASGYFWPAGADQGKTAPGEKGPDTFLSVEPIHVELAAVLLLWIVLFVHNATCVPLFAEGFDATAHLDYIQYIQEHKALPLANEGWEMYQPPLFYLVGAALLGICGLGAGDPGALLVLRLLGLAIGLGQLVLVAACLRLLFPEQPRRQLIGLALAAFLPVHLYLCHYITNESLLMLLGTAAVFLCLRLLRRPLASWTPYAGLGLCLGAALLTKITAVVVVGVVLVVLAGKLIVAGERRPGVWLRTVVLTALVTVMVGGWHYARVWARFGTPLLANFDRSSGYQFWQDPGYGTFTYLGRFGRGLTDPFFSALDGLPDALYSTLWGDGLCAGRSTWAHRPPWNYEFMAAGYGLALIPSLAIALGLVLALLQLLRQPRAEWFLVLGLGGGLAVALLYLFLRLPYYGHAKAIYEIMGMITLCALGALGIDFLVRLNRFLGAAILTLFGVWAGSAYLSCWIRPDSAATQVWAGLQQLELKQRANAQTSFQNALRIDPHFVPACLDQAGMLLRAQQFGMARQLFEQTLHDDPDNADALFGLAFECQTEGRIKEALDLLQRTSELAPDNQTVYSILGSLLVRQNRLAESIAAFREALRVVPSNPGDHANLGLLLMRSGRTEQALAQYRRAIGLRADQPAWLADLAWILATREETRYRDPAGALGLAEDACERTSYRDGACLQALAAAQAAGGRYGDASRTARRALLAPAVSPQPERREQLKGMIRHFDQGQPFVTRDLLRTEPYPPVRPLNVNEKP